jgi:hypothetical protein
VPRAIGSKSISNRLTRLSTGASQPWFSILKAVAEAVRMWEALCFHIRMAVQVIDELLRSTLQFGPCEVGPILEEIPHPFLV